MDDRGNGGKTLVESERLSSTLLLAVDVMPVNDAPSILIPTADANSAPLSAEEDRVGIVGVDCCGWSTENIAGATIISNSSIVLSDADIEYQADGVVLQQRDNLWTLTRGDGMESPTSLATYVNDTVSVTISVSHGGILLHGARSEVTVAASPAATGDISQSYTGSLHLSGPMWAVADSLKGMRYKTNLNWNSWVGSGGTELRPVLSEVRTRNVQMSSKLATLHVRM